MEDTEYKHAELGKLLEKRLMDWEQSRKPQELKMIECYQDVMRIARDDDTKGSGAAKAKKTNGIFVGSTRNKVRSARAKINDALFGNGQMPFDTNPTNEELAPFADVIEDILTEQMEKMGFQSMIKTGVNSLATYGTGFIYGPFVKREKLTEIVVDNSLGIPALKEEEYEYDAPYFELGSTLDSYPDPEARNIKDGLGIFWATFESKHTIEAWEDNDRYTNVDLAVMGSDGINEPGSDIAQKLRGNVEFWHQNDRIKVARFFGKIPEYMIGDDEDKLENDPEDATESTEDENKELVDAIVIMAGGIVVKVDRAPYKKTPALRCVYEDVEHEMWGVGIAENNSPHQKVTNAAFRLFLEGKGMALLGTSSVDRSKFLPTEDFKKFPGKVYQMKPGLTPEERTSALMMHNEPDVTGGWIDVIRISEQFSDDDTAITKYTQGDDSSNLNKTATGISMIMSASSMPIKEVISNIDKMWIEEIVERMIDWNLKYLEVETVRRIHGEEKAAIWEQIKQFGKTSFMEWNATGVGSFMQKEVLTNKVRAFAQFALSNPLTAQEIDVKELLTQTWDIMEIGRESPIKDDEKQKQIPPEVQQAIQQAQEHIQQQDQVIQQMQQALEQAKSGEQKAAMDMQLNMAKLQLESQKLEVERMRAETERAQAITEAETNEEAKILLDKYKADLEAETIRWKANLEAETKLQIEGLKAMGSVVEIQQTDGML